MPLGSLRSLKFANIFVVIFRANSIHFERAIKSLANKSSSKRRLGKVKKEWTTIGEQERKKDRKRTQSKERQRERERERERIE